MNKSAVPVRSLGVKRFPPSSAKRQLRAEAEAALIRTPPAKVSPPSVEKLLHELQVHQIELEMQNDALRQTQGALEESRDRYMNLYEFAPVGYLTLTDAGLITEISLTAAALLKEDRKELFNRHFVHLVAPGDRDRWQRHFRQALQHEGKQTCELGLLLGDGTVFDACLDSLLTTDGAAGPALRLTLTNITPRKQIEAELRIASIAFESQEGMIVTDPNGIILRVNRAFTQLTGFSAAEVIGRKPSRLKSGRQDKTFYQRMWQALVETNYWQGELWNRRKNGELYAEWLTVTGVVAPNGVTSHYIGAFSEITKNKEAEAEIHRLAYYDPLTNLPNRRLLHDRIGQALVGSSRSGHYGAVVFLDLDNFKTLNDTRGHDVGDQLLVEMARRIQANVRGGDTVARLGGDEFVLIFEDLSSDIQEATAQISLMGEKIREAILQPCDLGGRAFHCTGSFGATLYRGQGDSVTTLLKYADLAMYKAKSGGRNMLRFFDPSMQIAGT